MQKIQTSLKTKVVWCEGSETSWQNNPQHLPFHLQPPHGKGSRQPWVFSVFVPTDQPAEFSHTNPYFGWNLLKLVKLLVTMWSSSKNFFNFSMSPSMSLKYLKKELKIFICETNSFSISLASLCSTWAPDPAMFKPSKHSQESLRALSSTDLQASQHHRSPVRLWLLLSTTANSAEQCGSPSWHCHSHHIPKDWCTIMRQ